MSIEPAQPPEALAEAPFDDARADLILRSSDSVHFRVFKIILSLASPVFAGMFSIPSPAPPQSLDEIQVVPLSEHSKTLDVALRHLYPVRSPGAITLHDASTLAEFADKYEVDGLGRFITHYLANNVEQDPVGVYTIAAKYGYKDIGAKAAQSCQRLPFSRLQSPYIQCATAELHAELLRYHAACGEAASAVTSKRGWFSSLGSNLNLNMDSETARRNPPCLCIMQDFIGVIRNTSPISLNNLTQPVTERYGPKCLWNYLYRSALVLAHHPTAEAINSEDFILKTYACTLCPSETRRQMLELGIILGREVKKAVEGVPLPDTIVAIRTE